MRYEPANSIIIKLGGLTAVSKAVGVTPHTVMRWRMPKHTGGTGGVIPHWHIAAILDFAEKIKVELREADFAPIIKGRAA